MACEGNLAQGAPSEGYYMQYSIFPKGLIPSPGDVLELGGGHKAIYSGSYCQGQLEGRKNYVIPDL